MLKSGNFSFALVALCNCRVQWRQKAKERKNEVVVISYNVDVTSQP